MKYSRRQFQFVTVVLLALLLLSGAALAAPDFSADSLAPGDTGDDVVLLQQELVKLGLMDSVTGEYDEATAAVVVHMQHALGLEETGIFTPGLLSAYIASLAAPTPSSEPTPSPTVEPTPTAEPTPSQSPVLPTATPAMTPALPTAEPTAKPLAGHVIGIDPGHQLNCDSSLEPIAPGSACSRAKMSAGATGIRTNIPEYRTAMQISLKLKKLLEDAGATVIMSRTENDVSLSNAERAQLMNASGAELWIRIHCNYSSYSRALHGASVLIPSRAASPDIYDCSLALGRQVLSEFCACTGASQLSLRQTSLQTGFNWSNIPVAVIEMGYLSNPAEDVRLNRNSYQLKCAAGIYAGILSYLTAQ